MAVKVVVRDGEPIDEGLRRFNRMVWANYRRRWSKRRYGYYEKPSALRRNQAKMNWRQRQAGGGLSLRVGLAELLSRTGPTNAVCH